MKIICVMLFIGFCITTNGQSIKNFVISSSGTFSTQNYEGGMTLGQPATNMSSNAGFTLVEGFHFLMEFNKYPECLTVYRSDIDGVGSFRNAIACAEENDTIIISPDLPDDFIYLDLPVIEINKNINIINANAPVYFRNLNPSNTASLIDITDTIFIQGIYLEGLNDGLILSMKPSSVVTWK